MHIIAQVGRDEVIASLRVVGQIGRKLAEGAHMCDTIRRIDVIIICHIIEVDQTIFPYLWYQPPASASMAVNEITAARARKERRWLRRSGRGRRWRRPAGSPGRCVRRYRRH